MNKTKHYYFNQMAKTKAVSLQLRDSFFIYTINLNLTNSAFVKAKQLPNLLRRWQQQQ